MCVFASVSSFLSAPPRGWERGPPNTRKRFCICSIMKGKEREEDKHGLHSKRTAEKKCAARQKEKKVWEKTKEKKEEKLFSCNADGYEFIDCLVPHLNFSKLSLFYVQNSVSFIAISLCSINPRAYGICHKCWQMSFPTMVLPSVPLLKEEARELFDHFPPLFFPFPSLPPFFAASPPPPAKKREREKKKSHHASSRRGSFSV